MAIVLGLDLGTSKLCAAALETDCGELVEARSCPSPDAGASAVGGRDEQSPQAIRDAAWQLVFTLLTSPRVDRSRVAAIGVTGQMHGVLLVDATLEPRTGLITWRDRRTEEGAGEGSLTWARDRLPADLPERAGCGLHAGYGGATLSWLAAHGEPLQDRVALSLADYIVADLTGVVATEPTHAASWGIYDVRAGAWADDAALALGVPARVLPTVRACASPLAEVLPGTARALGVPRGTVVCSPLGDNQAAVFAATEGRAHVAVANLGTGGQICVPIAGFETVAPFETRPMPSAGHILVGASLCGGWAYSLIREFLESVVRDVGSGSLGTDEVYARLGRLVEAAQPGSGGLRVDPRFAGERGNPDVRGALTGVGPDNLTVANLARATLEGTARELGDLWRSAGSHVAPEVVATGNAVRRNPVLLEMLREEFGVPVHLGRWEEEAAVGAALAAARSLGLGPDGGA
jgi:sugar (pentulose or hexulose) kinase